MNYRREQKVINHRRKIMKSLNWNKAKKEILKTKSTCDTKLRTKWERGWDIACNSCTEIIERNIRPQSKIEELKELYNKIRNGYTFHAEDLSIKDYDKLYDLAMEAINE
jgi:hypothetical protein